MIHAAMIENDRVVNMIRIDEKNMQMLINRGRELLNREDLGLKQGDYREYGVWYRDVDGIKTLLPIKEAL